MKMNYSYSVATESTASSPCSNVPIHCPICPKSDPAIWKYFMKIHFEEKHKTLLTKHEHLWKLSNFERTEIKKIWVKRGRVTAKRTKKANQLPLVVSEKHRAQIPSMYLNFISSVEGSITYNKFFLRDNVDNEEESKTDSEHEANVENENDFRYDNRDPARPEYETSPQSRDTTGDSDVDDVADNVDQGEVLDVGELEGGVVISMVRNSEDSDTETAVSQMMEGVAVAAKPSTDDSVSYDPSPATRTTSEFDPESASIEKAGRFTRKRGRGHIVDELNLNVCLCGSVVDLSMDLETVVKCKRSSCETQWVSKF
jgi:hypothetical protein